MAAKVLANYKFTAEPGGPAPGEILEAEHELSGQKAALKILRESEQGNISREKVSELISFNHPKALKLLHLGCEDDVYFTLSELPGGASLREILNNSSLPPEKALHTAFQIADVISTAHQKNIFHSAITAENVFVCKNDEIKLANFSLGRDADFKKDIHSLGALLYEMISGEKPSSPDGGPGIDESIAGIVGKSMSPLPGVCYESMDELKKDLSAELEKLGSKTEDFKINRAQKNVKEKLSNYRLAREDKKIQNILSSAERYRARGKGQSLEKAVSLYRQAADLKSARGRYHLGICSLEGEGIDFNIPEAVRLIKLSAREGYIPAILKLAELCLEGQIIPQDYEEAFRLYHQAAELGSPEARLHLGECYANAVGTNADSAKAVENYKLSAEGGNPLANYILGNFYYLGKDVEKDLQAAFRCYRLSALGENVKAGYSLGMCYLNGQGVEQNTEQAFVWLEKTSEKGEERADHAMAECYFYGDKTEKNLKKAFKLYRKAAESGCHKSRYMAGICLLNGLGVRRNHKKAFICLRESAAAGMQHAQFELGECFRSGKGAPRDIAKARLWYERAAEQGSEEAKEALRRLSNKRWWQRS